MIKCYRLILIILFIFKTQISFCQMHEYERLNFILLIDEEIPVATISDGYFVLKNEFSTDTFSFQYRVGRIIMKSENLNKLFIADKKTTIEMFFSYLNYIKPGITSLHQYNIKLLRQNINKEYMILNIYNYYNKYSRRKYSIKKGGYVYLRKNPGYSEILPLRQY